MNEPSQPSASPDAAPSTAIVPTPPEHAAQATPSSAIAMAHDARDRSDAASTERAAPLSPLPPPLPDPTFAAISAAEALSLDLTPAQRTAIEMLTTGHTRIASATAAGVNRLTLYRWLKHDLTFVAAYNAWQHDAIATARARLLALTDTAVTAIGHALQKGDGRLALNLLDRLGIASNPNPGSTDVEELGEQQSMARKRHEIEKRKEADKLFWEGVFHPPDFAEQREEETDEEA